MQPDPAREERNEVRSTGQTRNVEDAGAFEEERPLLGEKQRKARQVHLSNIGFGLGKVGVHRDRCVQVRREILEHIQAASELAVAGIFAARDVRPHVEPMSLTRAFEASQLSRVRQIADPARHPCGCPPVGLEQMLDLPLDVETPHGLVGSEPKRLEWNRNLGDPAVGRPRHRGIPDAVPIAAETLPVV